MCWDSDTDNILDDFYLKGLKSSKKYDRLAGYFSSTLFVRTAYETLDFIERGGMVRIVTSTTLTQNDLDTIQNMNQKSTMLTKSCLNEMLKNSDELEYKCKSLFGWLLKQKIDGRPQLEIKVAIPKNPTGTFHQKVGIFTLTDGGTITFSGSVNETVRGWQDNVEQFKVFKSWGDKTNEDAVINDQCNFKRYWENQMRDYTIVSLPKAIIDHLISVAPNSGSEFRSLVGHLQKKFYKKEPVDSNITLRDYQKNAIKLWERNNYQGILAMATGTGKTLTALGGISKLSQNQKRLIVVISSPQKHIANQWRDEIRSWNYGVKKELMLPERIVMAYSENPRWRKDIDDLVYKFNKSVIGHKQFLLNSCIVCTTHDTFATDDFIDKIRLMKQNNVKVLLIADEVHGVGSPKRQQGLNPQYEYRLGLSATPIRHYDEQGTEKIQEYFAETVYELPLQTAISDGHLVQYSYHPHYVEMTDVELDEYWNLTIKLARKYAARAKGKKIDENDTRLEEMRANIIATAENKYDEFKKILDGYGNNLTHCLVYCHPNQIDDVTKILTARNIFNEKITWEYPTQDRERIINALKNEQYQCVTAIRCLDEGYDIPAAKIAIILASAGDPRQYIQRRGRLLRPFPGKDHAEIHDILVKTSRINDQDLNVTNSVKKLVARELLRHKEFADAAFNKKDAYRLVHDTAQNYGIDLEELSPLYIDSI